MSHDTRAGLPRSSHNLKCGKVVFRLVLSVHLDIFSPRHLDTGRLGVFRRHSAHNVSVSQEFCAKISTFCVISFASQDSRFLVSATGHQVVPPHHDLERGVSQLGGSDSFAHHSTGG